jgi:hypothetical protein
LSFAEDFVPLTMLGGKNAKRTMKEEPKHIGRGRVVAGGALWALLYNLAWGVAWFAFMRQEWRTAATAIGRQMPWTADVWILVGILTLPLGAAIVAYAASPGRSVLKGALHACVAMWAVLTLGMAISCIQFSKRVIALDVSVNLIAMLVASVGAVWSLPAKCRQQEPNQALEPTPTSRGGSS